MISKTKPNRSGALARRVQWRDLALMRPADGAVECLHPLPWLLGSWWSAGREFWPAALVCSFMFFLTALRLNHEAIHGNLGFGPRAHRLVQHGLSALMLGSNSAVGFNHLQHHVHVGKQDDVEGKCGQMGGLRVLAYGPAFPIELHLAAWRRGGPILRRRMLVDLALNIAVILTALVSGSTVLLYHLLAVTCAQCLTAFFAVWITHRGCHGEELIARTQRSRLINFATYNMFFHLEHHLFPGVPVRRLGRLAARLDAALPELAARARRVI
jgi:fatty acid desaturase